MPNIAAPGFWDQSQSGVHINREAPVTETLAEALAAVDAPLADYWDGTRYDLSTEQPARLLFVAPTVIDVPDLYLDLVTNIAGDTPAVILFGTDGQPLDGGLYISDNFDERLDLGGGRIRYRIMRDAGFDPETGVIWEQAGFTGVKAMLITGTVDYPQGRPEFFYGLEGTTESADVPFWTGFTGQFDGMGAATGRNRITELF